jgi:aspartate kinase
MSVKVLKFGGTSVQHAEALARVRDIVAIRAAAQPCIVVLSATSGTTDALLRIARERDVAGVEALRVRHQTIVDQLVPTDEARAVVNELCDALASYVRGMYLLGETTDRSIDEVASYGERLSSSIVAHACALAGMQASWLDARSVIRTDNKHLCATVDMAAVTMLSQDVLLPLLRSHSVVVTQGFIGATADGITTTLGRGGSDHSAAILGAAVGANVIEIWTDVSGIYSTDPRIVPDARPIASMGFDEVRDLALYGAKVLHPDTIRPAVMSGIPVHVLNTFDPDAGGTVITAAAPSDRYLNAAALIQRCTLFTWKGNTTRHTDNVLLFWSYHDGAACVVRTPSDDDVLNARVSMAELPHEEHPVAIIAVCGPQASSARAVASIATAVSDYPVRAVISGVSQTTCFVVCDESSAQATLRAIHAQIVQD